MFLTTQDKTFKAGETWKEKFSGGEAPDWRHECGDTTLDQEIPSSIPSHLRLSSSTCLLRTAKFQKVPTYCQRQYGRVFPEFLHHITEELGPGAHDLGGVPFIIWELELVSIPLTKAATEKRKWSIHSFGRFILGDGLPHSLKPIRGQLLPPRQIQDSRIKEKLGYNGCWTPKTSVNCCE